MTSPTGRAVALLVAAAATGLVWSPFVMFALIGAVAVAVVADALSARAPEVRDDLPPELVRGLPTPWALEVVPRPGTVVESRQPQTAEVRFDPAEGPGTLRGTVTALTRGRHVLAAPVTRTRGVLGLAVRVMSHGDERTITSHADLPGARRIAEQVRRGTFRDPGHRRGPIGLGTDFETIGEYTRDDDVRRINWPATERTGRPMVNRYREDVERELWCLIDAGRLLASPIGDRTRLDLALDALAAVAAVADAVGDRIGAIAFDDDVRRVIAPRRAGAAGLVRSLDDLEPKMIDSDYERAFHRVGAAKRSLVMVFTDILDGAASAPLLDAVPVLARSHAVVIAGVIDDDLVDLAEGPHGSADEERLASVATDLLDERDDVRRRLSAAGAVVVDARSSDLPGSCVGAYLALKAAARL